MDERVAVTEIAVKFSRPMSIEEPTGDPRFDTLDVYKENRQEYPTLASFMPKVVAFFDGIAPRIGDLAKRYEDSRPRLVSSSVPDGARDVDPAITEITVKFSRPMSIADPTRDPRFRKARFDETRTVLTMPVALEPGHDYEVWLRWPNGQSFTSADGTPMQPVVVRFRTKAPPAR